MFEPHMNQFYAGRALRKKCNNRKSFRRADQLFVTRQQLAFAALAT
jgi:hypothetical protein